MSGGAWSGTLDLIRQTLEVVPAWVTACAPAATADRIVVGIGGHPWDGTLLRHDGQAKPLALPLAQLALGEPEWEADGCRRWARTGSATLDVAMAGGPTPTDYAAAVQLAEDITQGFADAHDAGTCAMFRLRLSGPPLYLPQTAPSPFRAGWVFQLTLTWETSR